MVYGKAAAPADVGALVAGIDERIAEALAAPAGILRHGAWAAALVAAGELAQGLADAGAEAGEEAALALATALAGIVGQSWERGFAEDGPAARAAVADRTAALRMLAPGLPGAVEIRRTEGFSHYAVYPESFWQAARSLAAPRPTRVLGLRSIGTTLACCVAAALGAPPPVTVRPEGHPFGRVISPGPRAAAAMREGAGAGWAIVDEGPGLSGSSFGSAADALRRAGVPQERIVLFPSHGGAPGPMASAEHRRLWATARVACAPDETPFSGSAVPGRGLGDWFADLTGPLLAPPDDVAAGAWRALHWQDEAAWPAVDRQNERRKVLLTARNGRFLLRYTGLGAFGRAKFMRAQRLAAAGFGIAPLGWRHGFLIEPWRGDLRPLAPGRARGAALPGRLAGSLAKYLAFRADSFPAQPYEGGSLHDLLAMTRANAAEALGAAAGDDVGRWAAWLDGLAATARPIAVDGRLAPHEWLHDGAGTLLKTDALDHCCAHDLVGCQDVAWDVAGAAIEWDLDAPETAALGAEVARRGGRVVNPDLVSFFRAAYAALSVGALTLALDREAGAEADRLSTALARRVAALERAIG